MVTSSIDANPLDPNTMYKYGETTSQTHKLNDLDMIMERNVAPSSRRSSEQGAVPRKPEE
ncbi:hypothetical protein N7488_001933 [Penicillium malachiteum]|nr:hypothetical protein N7488_001933 [Penicillium malachiteum]